MSLDLDKIRGVIERAGDSTQVVGRTDNIKRAIIAVFIAGIKETVRQLDTMYVSKESQKNAKGPTGM